MDCSILVIDDETGFLESIKSVNPATACVMITAGDDVGTARACREQGAGDYLVKLFSRKDLVSCMQRAL
jgi:DNA-binding NtrC family response regulator